MASTLSTDPVFNAFPPALAQLYAKVLWQQKIWRPDATAADHAFFDTSLSAAGIKKERDYQMARLRGETDEPASWIQQIMTRTGPGGQGIPPEVIRGASDLFSGFGLMEREAAPPEESEALRAGAGLTANLLLFIGGLGAAKALPLLGRIGASGTKAALTTQAAATMGIAGGGTEAARQTTRALRDKDTDWMEVPLAAVSFAAGGVPAKRLGAAVLQGVTSAAGQGALKGDVDLGRVAMETIFAGVFGNPSLKQLRTQYLENGQWKMPESTRKALNKAIQADADSILNQHVKAGEPARASWILNMSKQPEEILKLIEDAGSKEVKASIRDVRAYKAGEIVTHPDAPAEALPRTKPKMEVGPNNTSKVSQYLNEHPGKRAAEIAESTGLLHKQVLYAIRKLNDKGFITKGAVAEGPFAGKKTYTLNEKGVVPEKPVLDWRATIREDLDKQLDESNPAKAPTLDSKEAAARMETRLLDAMESLDDPLDGPLNATPEQMGDMAEHMLGGKSIDEVTSVLEDVQAWPEELKPFREVIGDSAEKMFSQRPTPTTVEIEGLVKKLDKSPYVQDLPNEPWPAKQGIDYDIDTMRKWAGILDIDLAEVKNVAGKTTGWSVTHHGHKRFVDATFDAVHKHINAVASGDVAIHLKDNNAYGRMMVLANQKGLKVEHTAGTNKYLVRDTAGGDTIILGEGTGKDAVDDGFAKTAELVMAHGAPEDGVFNATRAAQSAGGAPSETLAPETVGPSVSVPKMAKSLLEPEGVLPPEPPGVTLEAGQVVTKKKVQPFTWWQLSRRTPMSLFQYADDKLGTSLTEGVHTNLHDQASKRDRFQRPFEEWLNRLHSGIPLSRSHVVDVLSLVPVKDLEEAAIALQATGKEINAGRELRKLFQELIGGDVEQTVKGLTKLREVGGDINALPKNTLPKELAGILEEVKAGEVNFTEQNAVTLASELINAKGRALFMVDALRKARGLASHLDEMVKRTKGPLLETYQQTSLFTHNYINSIAHRTDRVATQVAETWQSTAGALKKMGLIRGDELTPQDVERLAMMSTSWYAGSVMSFRSALAFRNLFQPLLLGPKVGYGRVLHGYGDAIKAIKSGEWKRLHDEGVVNEPAFFGFGGVAGSRVGGTMVQAQWDEGVSATRQKATQTAETAERFVRKLQSLGLLGFRSADQLNRVVTYYAGKRAILENKHLYDDGNISEFMIQSGLQGDSRVLRNSILKKIGKKNMWEEASHEYGKHTSRSSQFLYSKAEAPRMLQGVHGRALGQFGIWPMGYLDYMERNLGGIHGAAETNIVNMKRVWSKKARGQFAMSPDMRYRALFSSRYLAQLAALSAAGAATGIAVSSYNKANPLAFTGGPAQQVIRDTIHIAMRTDTAFEHSRAVSTVKRFMLQMVNPFGGATQDIEQMNQRLDNGEAPIKVLMEFLSFNLTDRPGGE